MASMPFHDKSASTVVHDKINKAIIFVFSYGPFKIMFEKFKNMFNI